jgi:transposase-like protein
MAKTRKKRQSYTAEQRAEILAAAQRDSLTAEQVKKKFGVTPVTYYSWRKKAGATRRRGGAITTRGGRGSDNMLRAEVQTRVRQMLPDIVRSEVNSYLDSLFGASGRKRRT